MSTVQHVQARDALEASTIDTFQGNVEFMSRLIRMFQSIIELPVGRYWLIHGRPLCWRHWRKSIHTLLGLQRNIDPEDPEDPEDPVKEATHNRFTGCVSPEIYDCLLSNLILNLKIQ